MDIEKTAEKVSKVFEQKKEKHQTVIPPLKIMTGRYLVGNSGTLLTQVTGIKNKSEREYIGVETAMNHILRPMLLDSYHHISVANDRERSQKSTKTLVVPNCTSIDVIAEKREVPEIKKDDLLAIRDVAAFGFTIASN